MGKEEGQTGSVREKEIQRGNQEALRVEVRSIKIHIVLHRLIMQAQKSGHPLAGRKVRRGEEKGESSERVSTLQM